VVRLGGMPTNGGGGLGAQVAGLRVKIERADAVFTVRAGEPYTPRHALDAVGFHSCIVTLWGQDGTLDGVAAKVTGVKEPKRRGVGRRFPREGSAVGGARTAGAPSCRGARMAEPCQSVRENLCRPSRTPSAPHFTQGLRTGLTYFATLGLVSCRFCSTDFI
jgi:hypothetical protein